MLSVGGAVAGERAERKLAAIFAADVEGYSRLMERDEVAALRTLTSHRAVMDDLIAQYRGRIANAAGDSVLAEFASVIDAVECALDVQKAIQRANERLPPEQAMRFRIGVHVGDVLVKGTDLFGDGVNLAARLQALSEPGGICVSGAARDYVGDRLPVAFVDAGEQVVKNIAKPVRVFQIGAPGSDHADAGVRPMLPLPDKPSIAVLPFTNMSGDPEQDYFSDGVVEDIITGLSRARWLFVIARNSSFAYKGRAVDMRQIGRELGVRYILEGSVRKAGNRLRITAQLIEAATGAHVWAERYDRDLIDLFALQDEITESVVGVLEPTLRRAEIERAKRKRPESLDAYDLYLRALPHFYAMTRDGNEEAERLLRRALAIDPEFGTAAALAALCLVYRVAQGWTAPSDEVREAMLGFASQALRIDKNDPEALSCVAHSLTFSGGGFEEAITMVNRAVAADPNSAFGWYHAGFVHMHAARPREAIECLQRALRLSPLDPMAGSMLMAMAMAYMQLGQDEDALAAATRATRDTPNFGSAWRTLAASLALLGRIQEARAAAAHVMELDPQFSLAAWDRRFRFHEAAKARFVEGMRKAGLPE